MRQITYHHGPIRTDDRVLVCFGFLGNTWANYLVSREMASSYIRSWYGMKEDARRTPFWLCIWRWVLSQLGYPCYPRMFAANVFVDGELPPDGKTLAEFAIDWDQVVAIRVRETHKYWLEDPQGQYFTMICRQMIEGNAADRAGEEWKGEDT